MFKKLIIILCASVLGVLLIVGATRDLPDYAQGLLTGRNQVLLDELLAHVDEQALYAAALASDKLDVVAEDAVGLGNDSAFVEQLETLDPVLLYDVALEHGLITQADVTKIFDQ